MTSYTYIDSNYQTPGPSQLRHGSKYHLHLSTLILSASPSPSPSTTIVPPSTRCSEPLRMRIVSLSKLKSSSTRFDCRTRSVGFGLAARGERIDGGFDDASFSSPLDPDSWDVPASGGSVVAPLRGGSLVGVLHSSEGSGRGAAGVSCIFEAASAGGVDDIEGHG